MTCLMGVLPYCARAEVATKSPEIRRDITMTLDFIAILLLADVAGTRGTTSRLARHTQNLPLREMCQLYLARARKNSVLWGLWVRWGTKTPRGLVRDVENRGEITSTSAAA